MISTYDLHRLQDSLQEVREQNYGTEKHPIWLDIELANDENWKVYLFPHEAPSHGTDNLPLYAELIHRGTDAHHLEDWLHMLESYGDTASIFIEATRQTLISEVSTAIDQKSFGLPGEEFGLELTVYHFGPTPQYLLSRPDDEYGRPLAGFLTLAEVEHFIARLEAAPADSYGELETATQHFSEAEALGWGDFVEGEIQRRRNAAARVASIARHPAGKAREIPGYGIVVEKKIGTLADGTELTTPVRSIFPEDHR